jgi:hypothetical protein
MKVNQKSRRSRLLAFRRWSFSSAGCLRSSDDAAACIFADLIAIAGGFLV